MGVDLGGCQGSMPEEFLNRIHICPLVQHMRCESMPENMRAPLNLFGYLAQVFRYNSINKCFIDFIARPGEEQDGGIRIRKTFLSHPQVFLNMWDHLPDQG